MKNALLIIATLVLITPIATAADILLLAGAPSHEWNSHSHPVGAHRLAKALNNSRLGITATVFENAWPEKQDIFTNIKTVVIYCDGEGAHLLNGHAEEMEVLSQKGVGLVLLHYAVEVSPGPLQQKLQDWIGGYFEINWSVNPTWTPKNITLTDHPITNGVTPFELEDEWYFHMRFRPNMENVTPILTALPPPTTLTEEDTLRSGNPTLRKELNNATPQHLAWAATTPYGARGFGLTGAHYDKSWASDDFRKLVLNAILWTAHFDIPENGVPSDTPIITKHETILRAVAKGDAEDVRRHCALGVDVNEPNKSGWTPLLYAAARNQSEICAILLEQGANVNATTSSNSTPLHLAIERNATDVINLLLKHNPTLNTHDGNGWTPLHLAAAKNQHETVRLLLQNGAPPNARSEAGGTPLHEAAPSADPKLLQLLLDHGTDPTITSTTGQTARDIAKQYNNTPALELLSE